MKQTILAYLFLSAFVLLGFTFETAAQTQINIAGPSGSGGFGSQVVALPNGNIVVTDPLYDAPGSVSDVGAVYLYNGSTGALISTITGTTSNDSVGNLGVTVLTNGNYVVRSSVWNNGAIQDAGAATFCNRTTGCTGEVSAANSLVGSAANDTVGIGITALTNGNYVVRSPNWDNAGIQNVGAATFCDGTTGCSGAISAANSLVGSTATNSVSSSGVRELTNGKYVVFSPFWDNGVTLSVGAVTLCSGTSGCMGAVSTGNSLVGATANDFVGFYGITELTNGNYVVHSPEWNNGASQDAGAATFCDAVTGCAGVVVSAATSLIGSTTSDRVGDLTYVIALTNGDYVVRSPIWDNAGILNVGAVTYCDGTMGCTGAVSTANSLVGSTADDRVGITVTALTNGNYVVQNQDWDNTGIQDAGAATWCSGTAGCTGAVSAANSLVGSTASDGVGRLGVTALTNGNYVVLTESWDNGAIQNVGAATFCDGTMGCTGAVSTGNSLVGSKTNDFVGSGAIELTNGNYVVRSSSWNNGAIQDAGAVTRCSGTTGCTGAVVSAANSLVGSTANDFIGIGITALTNGNYAVRSRNWDNGAIVNAGAITYGNGNGGTVGAINSGNSVLGTAANGGNGLNFSFDATNNQLVVGRPFDNIVTLFRPAVPTAAAVTVSGRVSDGKRGISRARVTLTDSNGMTRTVQTNPFGYYRFEEVSAGETYIFNVSAKRYSFVPQVVSVTEDLTDLNFTAYPNAGQILLQ